MLFGGSAFNEDTHMQEFFTELAKRKFDTVVETGTYEGITTIFLAKNFEKVFTFEVMEEYYKRAVKNLVQHGIKNVKMAQMDSAKGLDLFLKHQGPDADLSNTIFFLDAHWYTNPLLGELKAMAESKICKNSVVVIHDMQNPFDRSMRFDQYPEQNIIYNREWIIPSLDAIFGKVNEDYIISYNAKSAGARTGCMVVASIDTFKRGRVPASFLLREH